MGLPWPLQDFAWVSAALKLEVKLLQICSVGYHTQEGYHIPIKIRLRTRGLESPRALDRNALFYLNILTPRKVHELVLGPTSYNVYFASSVYQPNSNTFRTEETFQLPNTVLQLPVCEVTAEMAQTAKEATSKTLVNSSISRPDFVIRGLLLLRMLHGGGLVLISKPQSDGD